MSALPKSPRLRRILAAYTVNRLGTWFGFVALSVAVFTHTHSALAVAALLITGQALPAIMAPALAVRVEASSRRGVLSGLYVFEGVVTTLLAVLLWHFWLPAILVLVALDGTAALAASALLRAETARAAREQAEVDWEARADWGDKADRAATADREAKADRAPTANREPTTDREARANREAATASRETGPGGAVVGDGAGGGGDFEAFAQAAERQANATLNIAFSGTFMLGPAIAGVVVAAAGAPAALLIDAASFLICGAMLGDLRPHTEEAAASSVRARLRAAVAHVSAVPALRGLLLAEAVALIFFDSAGPIEVAYAKSTLHAGDRGYGLLLAAWGVGVVVGSVIFARSPRRGLGAMLTGGTLAMGLAYIAFSVAPALGVACVAAVLGGVGNGVEWASVISIVQRLTPPPLHGRLMSAVESIGALSLALGLSLGGVLVALSSPRDAFLVVGIGATAMTFPFLWLALHGIDRGETGEVARAGIEVQPRETGAQPGDTAVQPRETGAQPGDTAVQPRETGAQPRDTGSQPEPFPRARATRRLSRFARSDLQASAPNGEHLKSDAPAAVKADKD